MSMQDAIAQLGGELCGFDVVANPATLQKIPDVPAGLAGTEARLLEASCRQASDFVWMIHASMQWSHTLLAADHLQLCPCRIRPTFSTQCWPLRLPVLLENQGQVCHAGQRPQTC